jgi:hypothetical protein
MSSELQRILGRIEARVESLPDLERRIRNLEKNMWTQSGGFALFMIAWTLFGSYITKTLGVN